MAIFLNNLHILALDCQTTGATPDNGKLLEIGWVALNPLTPLDTKHNQSEAYLFKLPHNTDLPRPVQKITGINDMDLSAGRSEETIQQKLYQTVRRINTANQNTLDNLSLLSRTSITCPTVIHFARFEKPFFQAFTKSNHFFEPEAFHIICTHEIIRRLLPELPRKGLRAVAGYFGYALPKLKRSADHAHATAFIWRKLVSLLEHNKKIRTLPQLIDWIKNTRPKKHYKRTYPMDSELRRQLPDQPGIYRMLRKNGDPLYIGKATSLKQRVNSYFRSKGGASEHILEMLTQAYRLDVTATFSALEAALLESDEIKYQSPPYNVALCQDHRQLVFISRDLTQISTHVDEKHSIGPLPWNRLVKSFEPIGRLIGNKDPFAKIKTEAILAIPKKYAPDRVCLSEGFQIFCKKYEHILRPENNTQPLGTLMRLGMYFWRQAADAPHANEIVDGINSEAEINPDDLVSEKMEDEWYPERVSRAIEHVIRRSTHMIRRARWFCILSDSSLAWTSPRAGENRKFFLMMDKGTVRKCHSLDLMARLPTPRETTKRSSPLSIKRQMDLATYDRLRVLTTELRRLVATQRDIELRLGQNAIWSRRRLSQLLYWV